MARVRPSAKGRSRPNVRSRKISLGLMEHRAMSSSISGISESSLQEPGWPSICAWLGSTIVQLVQFTTGIRSDWPNPPPGSASEHVYILEIVNEQETRHRVKTCLYESALHSSSYTHYIHTSAYQMDATMQGLHAREQSRPRNRQKICMFRPRCRCPRVELGSGLHFAPCMEVHRLTLHSCPLPFSLACPAR